MRVLGWGLLGLLLHLLLVLTPLVAIRPAALADPTVLLFALLATAFFYGDLRAKGCGAIETTGNPRDRGRETERQRAVSQRLAMASGVTILGVFWLALVTHSTGGFTVPGLIGALLMALGVAMRVAAIGTLNQFFVSDNRVALGQPLVQVGVYRWLRHPSEAGILAIALGSSLLLRSPVALLLWAVVLLPLVLWRTGREDRLLERVFADEFRAYAARVKGLFPLAR